MVRYSGIQLDTASYRFVRILLDTDTVGDTAAYSYSGSTPKWLDIDR